MGSEWTAYKFEELCDITRGASPRPINDWISDEGIPWLKISDATATSGRCIKNIAEKIKETGRNKSVTVYPGDLVLSNSATPGLPKFMGIEACIHDGWLLLRNFRHISKEYVYYVLLTERANLVNLGNGSVFTNLKTEILKSHKVKIPDSYTQNAIVEVLAALDNKIELNQRMSDTLEGIARALFKSWFVDFDPVKAKAEGREPEAMDDAVADLFPSSFIESSFGSIPEGWVVSEIGKEVEVVGGSTPSTQEEIYWDNGNFYWATPKDLSKLKSPILLDTERKITELGIKQISSGQLPIDTVLLSSRAPVGYIALTKVPVSINQGFIAMKCNKKLSPYFVLNWTYHTLEEIKARASGTTFAEISKSAFRPIKVIVPNLSLIQEFNSIVIPIYNRIADNERNISSLTETRDLLLPRLISGKLRIREIPEETDA